jgi:hypothetical protein
METSAISRIEKFRTPQPGALQHRENVNDILCIGIRYPHTWPHFEVRDPVLLLFVLISCGLRNVISCGWMYRGLGRDRFLANLSTPLKTLDLNVRRRTV